jgi:hypothetical protein
MPQKVSISWKNSLALILIAGFCLLSIWRLSDQDVVTKLQEEVHHLRQVSQFCARIEEPKIEDLFEKPKEEILEVVKFLLIRNRMNRLNKSFEKIPQKFSNKIWAFFP